MVEIITHKNVIAEHPQFPRFIIFFINFLLIIIEILFIKMAIRRVNRRKMTPRYSCNFNGQ